MPPLMAHLPVRSIACRRNGISSGCSLDVIRCSLDVIRYSLVVIRSWSCGWFFWLFGEGQVSRADLMCDRISPEIEPPATSGEVYPSFGEPALRVRPDMQILRPFDIRQCVWIRICDACLCSVVEFGFVAQSAVGTRDVDHTNQFISCRGRSQGAGCRSQVAGCRARVCCYHWYS